MSSNDFYASILLLGIQGKVATKNIVQFCIVKAVVKRRETSLQIKLNNNGE